MLRIMTELISIGSQDSLTYVFKKHKHNTWEVTYYYYGEGQNITNKIPYDFIPGTIVCQPPELIHEDISENGYKNIYFLINSLPFDGVAPLVIHDTPNKDFLRILRQLYNEFHINGNNPVTDAMLNVLREYLIRFSKDKKINSFVDTFERNLIQNFSNPLFSLYDSLKEIPFSKNHFRKLFEADIGVSPKKYLMTLRLTHAQKLLESSTLTIKQVATQSGFTDQYYFSRTFCKYVGMSPREWRIQKRKSK